jgi:AcrR family transcriptional regulator
MKNVTENSKYHHGDLRASLLEVACKVLHEEGIEGLSLRKLADRVGVSRTAPYHHFKNKNELLCAIAERGFEYWQEAFGTIFNQKNKGMREKYREFVLSYIKYATDNPEMYDLMFGRVIWKNNHETQSLKDIAYPCFQNQIKLTRNWQREGYMAIEHDSLRLAQVAWGTLHEITRLLIDGIFADSTHIEEMCNVAVELFIRQNSENDIGNEHD